MSANPTVREGGVPLYGRLMKTHRILLSIIAMAALCLLLFPEPTVAQCAMCRASLSGSMRNFNLGVLVLLAPPVAIFCTIFIVAIRNRKG